MKLDSRARFRKGEVLIPESFVIRLKKHLKEKRARKLIQKKKEEALGKTLKRIVLDPGHGGRFPGACAFGLREKDINLSIALKVKDLLEEKGIEVLMTRRDDTELSDNLNRDLDLRCDFTNSKKADVFVSIHANGCTNPAVTGFEVYIVRPHEDLDSRTNKAAREAPLAGTREIDEIVWRVLLKEYNSQSRELAGKILEGLDSAIDDDNGGLREAGFRVVKWTRCPAVLVEVGNMSNRTTAKKLATGRYRMKIAQGIASGILGFKKEYDATCGFTKSYNNEGSE
jgi:N-acetylmuramoyl-L-alanine amidase